MTGAHASPSRPLNPFKGPAPFPESDSSRLLRPGRGVAGLLGAVAEDRLLAVVGPSGIGKSSLRRAGLLPALRCGAVTG